MQPDSLVDRLVLKPLNVPVIRSVIGIHQFVLCFKTTDGVNAVKTPQHLKVKPAFSRDHFLLVQLQFPAMP